VGHANQRDIKKGGLYNRRERLRTTPPWFLARKLFTVQVWFDLAKGIELLTRKNLI